ncbi:MAG TPA: sulfurtransferase [Usitatibacter sp.]|nr:sulfurtransferase [Usitatibacter sp.]
MEKILVGTEELERHLGDPDWVVFDTRHDMTDTDRGRRSYAAGHIPGAYFLHVDDDLSGRKTGTNGRHPLPDLAAFAAKIDARGVKPGTQVVVYDDLNGNFAVRLWWMLRWLGHEKVALLDGGWPLWDHEERPVSTAEPAPRKGQFVAKPHLGETVDTPFVERFREDPSIVLIDARAPDRFNGLKEPIDPVAGHIPGAVNRFWQKNLQPDGRFKAPAELRKEYDALLGPHKPELSVHMCGSGVTACHNMFAMALAGLAPGRLYPGSWSEWCADRSRPVSARP